MRKLIFILSLMLATFAQAQVGQPYTWPQYSPTVDYNYKRDHPAFPMPTKILDDCAGVVGTTSDGWWCFRWGKDRNPTITDLAITNMLKYLNSEFAYFRDQMGWPPDMRAQQGYKSSVYLYGSGLCTDQAPNTEGGGWQGNIWYNGRNWPMILASYIPVQAFDPKNADAFQTGAMVHEGIHAVLADMPGAKQAAWFHEGGNVWLQQTATARKGGDFRELGFLNAGAFIAPFMPIECYSGWLLDGSFGGPSAEGVNQYGADGKQLCNWRNLLGGHQYGSVFPTVCAQILGDGSIPWIWANCPVRILEGLAGSNGKGIGDAQMKRMIVQYRSKMALVDMGEWTNACLALLNNNFGINIAAEYQPAFGAPEAWKATPYAKTTQNGTILTPEARTLPGWTGANQIPLKVTGDMVTVDFQPIGANMTCQLVYRTTAGMCVYSEYVSSGECSLKLDQAPANGVVIAVITNTDYIYKGDETRKAKYDYRLGLVKGVTGTADINTRWYNVPTTQYTFKTSVVGSGRVDPAAGTFGNGTNLSITASPAAGFRFSGWSGDTTSTTNPLKLTITKNISITANFVAIPQYTLTTSVVGTGTVNPSSGTYDQGSTVNLTATAAAGYMFSGWSGDATGNTNPLTVTMGANKNIVANFTAIPNEILTYNVSMNPLAAYTPITVKLDATRIAAALRLTTAQITAGMGTTVIYSAIEPDGTSNTASTANNPGHWFNNTGGVTTHGTNSFVYSELNIGQLTANIGQYPNACKNGDSYTIKQALVYTKSATEKYQVTLVFNIAIGPQSTVKQTIALAKGWNLISTNVRPTDSTITTLFNGLDVLEIKDMNTFWRKGQTDVFNGLKKITTGNGYLINMNATGTLTVTGTPVQTRLIASLPSANWNLIGCPYQTSTAISTIFNATNSSVIKNFTGFWTPTGGAANSILNFEPGKAYFIKK